MQPTRIFIRSPQVCRIAKAPATSRSMSLFSNPPFLPRFPHASLPTISNELAPFFRLMEDLTDTTRGFDHFSPPARIRSFQPRFDVREIGPNYELRGELPGVESKDIEVEFTDAQTLVIRGRTESDTTSGIPSAPAPSAQAVESAESAVSTTLNAVADTSDAASTQSASSYQQATVEDEAGAPETSVTSTPGPATPADSTTSEAPQQQQQVLQTTATPAESSQSRGSTPRYWVSERSTGSFQRVFNFPTRVSQEGVTASLKNGILNIVVPKAVAPELRRVVVQ